MKRICIVGISGKLGQYMTEHALKMGFDVQGVCRPESVGKLARFGDKIKVFPGRTNDREVIREAVAGCDGVLTVLAPWGVDDYASGTAKAVLEHSEPGARLVFSCGLHISMDGQDRFGWKIKLALFAARVARITRLVDIDDQYRATDAIFASNRLWTVVRGPNLEEGESQGLPVWSHHAQDPVLASNLVRRTDFALFMVNALTDDSLIHEAPAIVSAVSESAVAYAA
jgi:hypothetical protein